MHVPNWMELALLAFGAFRVTRLVAYDDLTITLRRWVTGLGDQEHHSWAHAIDGLRQEGHDPWYPPVDTDASWSRPPVGQARFYLGKMIRCPWCAGWWISLACWACWYWQPSVTIGVSIPLAVSSLVGLIAKNLDP